MTWFFASAALLIMVGLITTNPVFWIFGLMFMIAGAVENTL